VTGFLLALLAVSGWEARESGRTTSLAWIEAAVLAEGLGWWYWESRNRQ
jgi:hypothetical protein